MRLFLKKIKSGFLIPATVFVLLCSVFSLSAGAVKTFGKPVVYGFGAENGSTFSSPSGTVISSGALSWKLYDSRESRQTADGLSIGEGYVLLKDTNPLKNMSDFRLEIIYSSAVDGESESGKPFFLTSTKKNTMIQYITDGTPGFGISENGDVYFAGNKINHADGEKPEDILSSRNPAINPGDECRLTVKYVGGKLTVTLTYNSGKTTVTLAENYECVISGLQQMVLGGDKGNRLGGFTYKSLSVSEYTDYVPDADSGVSAIVILGETIKEYDNADTALNDALKQASGGNSPVLKFYADITLKNTIKISDGRSLTVDLNGHTVNRNRHSVMSGDGCVFLVGRGASLTVEDSSPDIQNYSTAIRGGVITGGAGDDIGGGIQLADNSILTMTGGSVVGCVTNDHGGAIRVDGDNVKINIRSAGFYSNMTLDSTDNSHGGAVYADGTGCKVTIADSIFEGNYSEDNGGAVYINEGRFTAINCLFNGNKCLDHGGAVYVEKGAAVSFDNCTFIHNRSDGYAGAVYCNSSNGTRLSGKFRNNSAGKAGGALFVNGDAVSVQDAEITGNTTGDRGGAMYVDELYDINIQGRLVVKDNYREDKTRDDIFLDSIGIATAHIYDGGLYDGSEVWVLTSGNQTVSEVISDYQQRYFHSDDPSKTLLFSADGSKTRGQTLITSAIGGGNVKFIITAAAVIAIAAVTAVIVKSKRKGAGKNEK